MKSKRRNRKRRERKVRLRCRQPKCTQNAVVSHTNKQLIFFFGGEVNLPFFLYH